MTLAWQGKRPVNIYRNTHRYHAEESLCEKGTIKTNSKNVVITIIRVRLTDTGNLELSDSRPCRNCRGYLQRLSKYRLKKFGQTIRVRYSENDQTISQPALVSELPYTELSKWYRVKYNLLHKNY